MYICVIDMTENSKSAQEKYREKIKRISVKNSSYNQASIYLDKRIKSRSDGKPIESLDFDPIDDNENRVMEECLSLVIGTDDYEQSWSDRLVLFAERNGMSKEEAIEEIVFNVLDESGHIEETFRKQRLFRNELW